MKGGMLGERREIGPAHRTSPKLLILLQQIASPTAGRNCRMKLGISKRHYGTVPSFAGSATNGLIQSLSKFWHLFNELRIGV